MRIAAILLAGGMGSRFGPSSSCSLPKQYTTIAGHCVLYHAAKALHAHVSLLQPVGDPDVITQVLAGISHLPPVMGGAKRQDSVRAGLEVLDTLPENCKPDYVLIHDGARPYITDDLIRKIIQTLSQNEVMGVIPAIPIADTLKQQHNGYVSKTISRDGLFRAQTPQGFNFRVLANLHKQAARYDFVYSDDSMLLERERLPVMLIEGNEDNIKLTYPEDLARLERVMNVKFETHTGLGFDVHPFGSYNPLVLCGITVPHHIGLKGYSDADVGIHALCDAIYGAIAEGDIGQHFPPDEMNWKNADSSIFLVHARKRVRERGGHLINADITLICERPKIRPYVTKMQTRLAELLDVTSSRISIKATTTEKLGFTGREEGIACQAITTIALPQSE